MTNKARDFAIKWHGDQRYGDTPTAIYTRMGMKFYLEEIVNEL